ncbi:MAG: hypothetical protein IPH28_06195 [Cytophagaceae bacterium]|nr:hypothetical protein [Cytophagaceae bacterium]MBK9510589.1 hypothetical protein [Cytophagaceae bacterium]MBK9935539.1 hypothetical protein [Cytophagaceae bacterium]MBL0301980.1 hypothetical protein [Cytophagaceae bacterium]MBL0324805.1 hypothetical protein [Cytophagaceae bacterium]
MDKEIKDNKEIWNNLIRFLHQNTGKKPNDINSVLFLIGVQELGKGNINFSKEEKQDLMHIAMCKVLSFGDFYELEGIDKDGWPHWKNIKPLPNVDLKIQEEFIKNYIIEYFKKEIGLHI